MTPRQNTCDSCIIFDVTSNLQANGPIGIPNPVEARDQRDRILALKFVEKDEAKSAAREISEETGVGLRAVYRAIQRELEWARSEKRRLAVSAPSTTTDIVSGASKAQEEVTQSGSSQEVRA